MNCLRLLVISAIIQFFTACMAKRAETQKEALIIPRPKQVSLVNRQICFSGSLYYYTNDSSLNDLYEVLENELVTLAGIPLKKTNDPDAPGLQLLIDKSLQEEEYRIEFDNQVIITGADYRAVAMGTVTALQSLQLTENNICWNQGLVTDKPDMHFRGLLVDVARQAHDLETLKNIIRLCRWYKINYLQLHLTDNEAFTFPSEAYPQLVSAGSHFTIAELEELVEYAHIRGIQLIPELDVPGHSAQLLQKLPYIFGFTNRRLNNATINIGKEAAYVALDTLIGEIARIFHYSDYIHIGGDEAAFDGLEKDREITAGMRKNELQNMEELYWYFINRMHSFVKKRGKKTIVWEGFSKEGNPVIDKDITVMAWETKYQLPQDLLDGGFKVINASWKPLYVVNEKKWSPEQIYKWNVYSWQNWVPDAPSFMPIRLSPNENILGSSMASWEQPAWLQIPSLRRRIAAMSGRVWNVRNTVNDSVFLSTLAVTDSIFNHYLSPVSIAAQGLSDPRGKDGRYNDENWFPDTVRVALHSPGNYTIRYSLNGSPVDSASQIYYGPFVFNSSNELRYRAYNGNVAVGAEQSQYFELHPLQVSLQGEYTELAERQWEITRNGLIKFADSMQVNISASRNGNIRYVTGNEDLNSRANIYNKPFTIKDTVVIKAGLFINNVLVGKPWVQYFQKDGG